MAKKGSKLYINGTSEIFILDGDTIPEGYTLAKVFYINNGIENKRCYNPNNIPEGFVVGKLPLSRNWDESKHKHHSVETKLKISEAITGKYIGENNPFYGKHHSDVTKEIISKKNQGRTPPNKNIKLTDEQKLIRDKKLIEKYGSLEEFYAVSTQRNKETKLKKYGDSNYNNREKCALTTYKNFGVNYFCMTDDFRKGHGNTSKFNDNFKGLLKAYNLYISDKDSCEFPLGNYLYDFRVNNYLVEINPTITHNSYAGIYYSEPKDKLYHYNKLKAALDNNYKCIHIWDWDDPEKIVRNFLKCNKIYARKCIIKEVSIKDTNSFLNDYHLQNTCNGQTIRLGLYYDNELVQVITFGKPRYNKKYEYELLRLCTKVNYNIIGGASKLFKYFIKNYNPKSIISYCDNAKFSGEIYSILGFKLKTLGKPSAHWYNINTGQHITDNLLRQRGFDQLFGTNYGKGTSNIDLMHQAGFLEVYDCGQSVYIWE